jgi:hypothetical protein
VRPVRPDSAAGQVLYAVSLAALVAALVAGIATR